jgi:hypothetical protein
MFALCRAPGGDVRRFRQISTILIFVVILIGGSSRAAQAQVWTGAFGAAAGTVSGGYITLSIVVARAQAGHYLHEMQDIFGWTALPVLIGGSTGAALGYWEPDRLMTGFVYGSAGTLVGGVAGYVIGMSVSDRPEAKWAGGAIGAGAGMAIGSTLGVLMPKASLNPFRDKKTVVPVTIRIPL